MFRLSAFFLLLSSAVSVQGQVPVTVNMRSFSSAIKDGKLEANTEKLLYAHNTGEAGVITEQWFTGRGVMDENATIRIYIDGETTASLDFQLLIAHGIGFTEKTESQYIPWGTRRLGHAADGGIHNTYRIPFSKSFNVTLTHPTGGTFWYIIRGVENYPLVVGDLVLLPSTRLRLYKKVNVQLQPLEFITLANITGTAGYVYQITLVAQSSDLTFLEACMRAKIDGSKDLTWLSSGTEDFFLSAYYFNKGVYHFDNAGLTHLGNGTVSAYKFFENDPLLFTKSMELMWRCGEVSDGPDGCPSSFPPPAPTGGDTFEFKDKTSPMYKPTNVTSYVWVYEYW